MHTEDTSETESSVSEVNEGVMMDSTFTVPDRRVSDGAVSHSVDLVHRAYDAFFAGDLDAAMAVAQPDIVLRQDPALPWGGRYQGRDGVAEFALALYGVIESTVTTEVMFSAGDRVIQYGRSRGTVNASGAAFDIAECHVWTIRDGLIAEVDFFVDSPAILQVLDP
jgi:ketosteroid isomerase-like protein